MQDKDKSFCYDPKKLDNKIQLVNLFEYEFGIASGSFLLKLDLSYSFSSSVCTLPNSGRIRPLFGTFRCKTFPLSISPKSFPLHYCLGNFLSLTYFVLCCVILTGFGILSFGIAILWSIGLADFGSF